MTCSWIIEILTAYVSAPLRACAIQIPVSCVPVQQCCYIFAETCFSLDKVLHHHCRWDCGSTCDSCEVFLSFTSTATARSHQPAATSGEKNSLWTGCKALAWQGLALCFSLCYHQREKGIISVLPYKHSAAMQRPEGTTNTHRLAQKAPAGSQGKCVWSPAESSDIKAEVRRGEMKRSVGKIHKVSGTYEEGGGEALHV